MFSTGLRDVLGDFINILCAQNPYVVGAKHETVTQKNIFFTWSKLDEGSFGFRIWCNRYMFHLLSFQSIVTETSYLTTTLYSCSSLFMAERLWRYGNH